MGYHGRFEEEKQEQPKKKAGKIILAVILALVLLIGGVAVWGVRYYNELFGKMNIVTLDKNLYETYTEETALPTESEETQPMQTTTVATEETLPVETTRPPFKSDDIINILVVGQASREGEAGHIADSTILVTVNTYDGTVKLSSVLRDSLVTMPYYKNRGGGQNKFNMAYEMGYRWEGIEGAMSYVNLTMFHNFGVEVDYNFEISFESFTKVIDYMGGIEIELTEAEAKYLNNDDLYVKYDVQPGLQYLDGMAALSYARMRKAEGDNESDIKRSARQRLLIATLLDKVRGATLVQLQGVADILLPLITTTMTPADVVEILTRIAPVINDINIVGETIPISGTGWGEIIDIYEDGIPDSVIKFESPQQKRLIRAITEAEKN